AAGAAAVADGVPASAAAVVASSEPPIAVASGTWKAMTRADPAPVSASAMSGLTFLLRTAVNLLEFEMKRLGAEELEVDPACVRAQRDQRGARALHERVGSAQVDVAVGGVG